MQKSPQFSKRHLLLNEKGKKPCIEHHVSLHTRSKEPSQHALRSRSAGQETRQDKTNFNQLQSLFFPFLFQHYNGQQEAIS